MYHARSEPPNIGSLCFQLPHIFTIECFPDGNSYIPTDVCMIQFQIREHVYVQIPHMDIVNFEKQQHTVFICESFS